MLRCPLRRQTPGLVSRCGRSNELVAKWLEHAPLPIVVLLALITFAFIGVVPTLVIAALGYAGCGLARRVQRR